MNSQFNKPVNLRLSSDILKLARLVVRKNRGKYDNLSHYIRVAVILLNRAELEAIKKKM